MVLPRGITGFFGASIPAPPGTDFRAFKALCHEAARRLGGTVLIVELDRTARNFHYAALSFRDRTVAILCNAHFPVVGFARPRQGDSIALSFIDVPELAEVVEELGGYGLLSAAELNARPDDESLSGLAATEIEQVRYWDPERIGDIIFNYWD
jgi:hypothetical protein